MPMQQDFQISPQLCCECDAAASLILTCVIIGLFSGSTYTLNANGVSERMGFPSA